MTSLIRRFSLDSRGQIRCAVAAAFLFFVLYTAPHRVHHFFEQGRFAPAPHDHHAATAEAGGSHKHDHDAPQSQPADCAAQLAAQNTHFASPPLIELPFSTSARACADLLTVARSESFNPSPFSQRAPPLG